MEIDLSQMTELVIYYGARVVGALIILIAGWIIGSWVKKRIHNAKRLDSTVSSFLGGFARYAVFAVSIIAVLAQFGVQTASLLAVLGAAGLAIGLALQGTLSNIAAGTMILILRPFNVGDYITFGDTGGTVTTLGLFGTELTTPDNCYIFAPNSLVWGNEITNYSRNDTRRQDITVGISYDSDIDKAIEVVQAVLESDNRVLKEDDKAPVIRVNNMGDSSVDLLVRVWSERAEYFAVQWDLKKAIKQALDENEIDIPFPTRTLVIEGNAEKDKLAA
jgi:small conductance mechanosensitive channel